MLRLPVLLTLCSLLGSAIVTVSGLGSQCSTALSGGTAAPGDPYWLQNITHQGYAPYAPDPSTYPVYRNVKDYGAVGDGVADDTDAINAAISYGTRCGDGCGSSTTTPAVIFFPQGTYRVSGAIVAYYYSVLVGDARVPPTLLASSNFSGAAVVDADPYIPNGYGAEWYVNQDNFYRSVRNFVIDLTETSATSGATGIHWQVSQSTSLMNIVFEMSTASGTTQRGIYMENGSGGFMGDMVFNGGQYGMSVGNQQFTVRNVTINNAQTALLDAGTGITINSCEIGFALATTNGVTNGDSQGVGSETIIDAAITDVTYFIQTAEATTSLDGSIVLNNIQLTNVGTAVGAANGDVVLAGGTFLIDSWAQGNVYSGTSGTGTFTQGYINSISRPSSVLASSGWIFEKGHPQYIDYAPSQFMSVKSQGAVGDANTDDTAAIQAVFDNYAGCYIIFFDAGIYLVSDTITIPAGSQVVGEAWTTIMGYGENFEDYNNPQAVIQVGASSGDEGLAEFTDMIFSTRGPTAGAIVVEWNVHDPAGQQGAAGTWDTYIILGGRDGTNLQYAECPAGSSSDGNQCFAAFMGLYITSSASAYLEGLWVWLADHDLDSSTESVERPWHSFGIARPRMDDRDFEYVKISADDSVYLFTLISPDEHSILYQYGLVNAANHYMGFIQTETPYFQPDPAPTAPFVLDGNYGDPTSWPQNAAWALYVSNSQNILIFGAGHYSFFQNYTQTCDTTNNCQSQIVNIDSTSSNIGIYGLNTVYATYQLSVNYNSIIYYGDNENGLADTVTAWTLS
ncbi:uncharacterized protein FIBRA_04006 [Fibroporia radiculosa]|uniref:Rhamnogalacturonase A/B/Epimerase-like pectate lyase domain-containing protein n=1 Tax=Fibroporia radiculosa TaxID=599839 RepID=J4G6Q0_9APHY|nr:uncharacterized protein FIBRA_04006 [Fibroporia radiculosa]CCM01933.1 predicted protein [Fibroporia radiculosa]